MDLQRISLEEAQAAFPDHEITEHLKSGGQKDVFVGRWDDQPIVLKTIVVDSYEASKRAQREVEAMKKIDSDILVDLIQAFPDTIGTNDVFVMVEEHIPGRTLRDYLNDEGPSMELAYQVGDTLLTVLQEFNEKAMVHRDIKPRNIMITPDGEPKLLDVGVVRMLNQEGLTPTARAHAPGTPKYSAPEQLANEKEKQDTRTDLFSTGIVISECCTGEHPFDKDGISIGEAIHSGERKPVASSIESEGTDDLDRYLEFLLSPRMNDRFNTPELALENLGNIRGGSV